MISNLYEVHVSYAEPGFLWSYTDPIVWRGEAANHADAAEKGVEEFVKTYNLGQREPITARVSKENDVRYFVVRRSIIFSAEEMCAPS